jgi:hypothetical protein
MLFAYREVPQASLGFSPFELLYGRTVRGPIAVLRQLWTDDHAVEEVRTTYQYVADLRNKLEEVCSLAQENLQRAKAQQARNYNKRAKPRQFEVGDKVLLLLPQEHNKLQVSWKGPYVVTEKVGGQTYRIQLPTKEKLYHANLLKRYRERETVSDFVVATIVTEDTEGDTEGANTVPSCPLTRAETPSDVECDPMLTEGQQHEIETLLAGYSDVLTEKPGRTALVEFGLKMVDDRPVQRKPYPLPHAKRQVVREEIEQMIALGVIEPADSPYSSPVVLVQKKDGTHRFCVDYRKLNQVTEFQIEMLPDPEHIFASVSKAKYFSKLDLSKGYWQIPVRKEDRPKLAFATPDGTYQWLVMPFGVQNAPSIFTRMMRKLLEPLRDRGVHNFMDDLLLATETWGEHLTLLADVLERLRQEGLTARPSKCHLGFRTLDYLGHTLSQGTLSPEKSKVEQLRNAARPTTKTEVRSFLGLAGYYRRYVANFSAIAGPLSDLTKKRTPSKFIWTDACEHAFQTLKDRLTSDAVVRLPDLDKEFVLRTDACDTGLGAVLLQEHDKTLFPVAYGSRKLSAAEKNYSVSERECLGIVFGISRFERYLYGRKFILETDHQPLAYLAQAKLSNGRLMRWSLFLQQYQMQIRYVKGSENVGADFMSRSAEMI